MLTFPTESKAPRKSQILSGDYRRVVLVFVFLGLSIVMAPRTWPQTHEDIESIDGLSPKEAIGQGRVKASPYAVSGKRYVPMSVKQAETYTQKGTASWYGYETYHQKDGHITANGEAFDPRGLSAAHKHLPLPTYVRVTNLENNRWIILRVNDRGPFVDGRIIDLSAGAAKLLGFYEKGTARVLVETVNIEELQTLLPFRVPLG